MDEKRGGGALPILPLLKGVGLRRFMEDNGMVDLGFQGNKYTWTNGRHECALIQE